jgi:DNA-binding MarR family transcriptional regulator
MVKMVDLLEQEELAKRKDHPQDRRIYLIDITDNGRKVLEIIKGVADEMENKLLNSFTEAERKIIRRALLNLAG